VLLASPSVRMDFHDSPEKHHAMMLQKYPRDWKRADADHDRNEKDRKDDHHDQRDDHRDNGGR
jgi:hypothetical protein